METISVVAEVQRRRRFSIRDKLIAVQESNEPGMTVSYVARKYGISPSLLFNWRRRMAQGGKQAIEADDDVVAVGEVRELKRRIRELERVLGKKTLENEILRDAVELAHQKNDLAASLVAKGRHSMKAISEVLGVSRSNLSERVKGVSKKRGPYTLAADA